MKNNLASLNYRDFFIVDEESHGTSQGLEDDDLRRETERAAAYFRGQLAYVIGSTITGEQGIETLSLLEQLAELQRRNGLLEQQITKLTRRLDQLMQTIGVEETVVLREVGMEQAKQEIKDLFASSDRTLYYSDIAEALGLDLKVVVRVCKELMKEGEITTDDEALRGR